MARHFEPFSLEDTAQSIAARFDRQVEQRADRIAISDGRQTWTYRQLDARANGVARELLRRCNGTTDPVALFGEQGAANVIATMGVLKAGHAYVPVDVTDSADRLRYVLADSGADLVVVVDERHRALAESLVGAERIVCFSSTGEIADNPPVTISPDAYAYLFYTSGSTGRPKGIADTHRNVLHNVLRYTNNLHISAEDRLTLLQSPHFSGAVSSMFAALLNGARSCPLNLRDTTSADLATYVLRERITIYHSVPSLFRSFLAFGHHFPDVRIIRLEGDQASRRDVEMYRLYFSDTCLLVNGLGATETGISLQYFVNKNTPLPDAHLPVGYHTPDMEVLLLDEGGMPMTGEVSGEIGVRSRYLAPGYWRRPDLTEKAFVASAPDGDGRRTYRSGDLGRRRTDGSIEHLGRKDFRAKIRGNTVEIADVEAALLTMPGVREAAVAVRADRRGENRLVAYVVPRSTPGPTLADVRRSLRTSLRGYMVPTALVLMNALPLSNNGKVDRRTLPEPATGQRPVDTPRMAPRNVTETTLAGIWSDLLGVHIEQIGVTDDFFDMGGDSLLAADACARAASVFGRSISTSMLAEAATIEQLAARLDQSATPLRQTLIPLQRDGRRLPFFAVHGHVGEVLFYRSLADRLGSDQPFYGLSSASFAPDAAHGYDIETIAGEYVRQMRRVQPAGPYRVGGYCLGGAVAFEMARQLEAEGERVDLLALFDADYPGSRRASVVRNRTRVHLARMATLGWRARVRYTAVRSRAAGRLIRQSGASLLWRAGFAVARRCRLTVPRRLRDVSNMNRDALRRYRPGMYRGRVVHFMSGGPLAQLPDPRAGWERAAASGITTLRVPGDLETMMQEPFVADLADKLRLCLDQASVRSGL